MYFPLPAAVCSSVEMDPVHKALCRLVSPTHQRKVLNDSRQRFSTRFEAVRHFISSSVLHGGLNALKALPIIPQFETETPNGRN